MEIGRLSTNGRGDQLLGHCGQEIWNNNERKAQRTALWAELCSDFQDKGTSFFEEVGERGDEASVVGDEALVETNEADEAAEFCGGGRDGPFADGIELGLLGVHAVGVDVEPTEGDLGLGEGALVQLGIEF